MSMVTIQAELICSTNLLMTVLEEQNLRTWGANGTIQFNLGHLTRADYGEVTLRQRGGKWMISFKREAEGNENYGQIYTDPSEFAYIQKLINQTDRRLKEEIKEQERKKEKVRLKKEQEKELKS